DLRLELDRGVGEVVALERLGGGQGGDGQYEDERGCTGSANERDPGRPPIPVGRGNTERERAEAEWQNRSASWAKPPQRRTHRSAARSPAASRKYLTRKQVFPPPEFCGFLGNASPSPSERGRNRAAIGAIA